MALIVVGIGILGAIVGYLVGSRITERRKEDEFAVRASAERRDAVSRSRSSLGGQFLEKISPHLPDFPYDPTELRFIGTPVDYVVFRGLATGAVEEVIFLEVKSGKGSLTPRQRGVRVAVDGKAVRWEVYRVPVDLGPDERGAV